jgi:hypothetical protein
MVPSALQDTFLVERGARLARARGWVRRRFLFTHEHRPLEVAGFERLLRHVPVHQHVQLRAVFERLEVWDGGRVTLSLEAMLSRFIP